jgi:hypothetical protein
MPVLIFFNMMKYLLPVFFFITKFVIAQTNIVLNPSFEENIDCPTSSGQLSKALHWASPTNGTPDLLNSCCVSPIISVPDNISGYQNPVTGNAYCGIYVFGSYQNREYIQGELTQPLLLDKKYIIKLNVSLSDSSTYAISNIGIYFSVNSFYENHNIELNYIPQIINPNSNFLNDKEKWIEIIGYYTAIGGEKYITVGNFNNNNNTDTLFSGGPYASYYYIDDVSVILDTTVGVDEEKNVKREEFKVYPNPIISGNELNIYLSENKGSSAIEVYNVMSSLIYLLPVTSKNVKIKTDNFEKGVYFIRLLNNNEYVDVEKVIIY